MFILQGIIKKNKLLNREENENYVIVKQGVSEGQKLYLSEPENAKDFNLSGFEIYDDILRKKELAKSQPALSSSQNSPVTAQSVKTGI